MIVRAKRNTNFTTISNVGMEDAHLTFKAKGILAYLLSKPDNWQVRDRQLATVGPDGRAAIQAALRELETHGYIKRIRERNEQGQWAYTSYVYDEPWLENPSTDKPRSENPATDKPSTGKPAAENRAIISTVVTSTDQTNTEETNTVEEAREADASQPPTPTTIPARAGASKKKRIESPHISPDTHFENGFIPPGAGENAVQVYYERFDITEDAARLNAIQEDDLVRQCTDLERLREAVTAYSLTNYRKCNIRLILDWYHGGVPQRAPSMNGASNGTHRRNNGFGRDPAPRDPEPEFVPDEKILAGMERVNAIRNGRAPAGG